MRTGIHNSIGVVCAVAIILWAITGCAPVDRWPVFKPEPDAHTHVDEVPSPEQLDRFRPQTAQEMLVVEMASPDQPLALSIEDIIVLTLNHNAALQVKQVTPVIAGTFEQIERGVFDPEVFAEFQYEEETASETSRATGEQFDVEASDTNAGAGLRQALPTGTALELSVEHERNTSNRAPDQDKARVGLSVTQSLLKGFGPAVNLLDIRQAELDTLASIYELRGFVEALVAQNRDRLLAVYTGHPGNFHLRKLPGHCPAAVKRSRAAN